MMDNRKSGGTTLMMAQAVKAMPAWKLAAMFVAGLLVFLGLGFWFVLMGGDHSKVEFIFGGGLGISAVFLMFPVGVSRIAVWAASRFRKKS